VSSPTLTYDNIVSFLNATSTGTEPSATLTFGSDSISQANVTTHINSVQSYLQWFLGPSIWNSTDTTVIGTVNRLWLLYASAYVLAALSGSLLITGFDVQVGDVRMSKSQRGQRYQSLITTFLSEAKMLVVQLTQYTLQTTGGQSPAGME
jgi:hypothetical protein